MYAQTDTDTRYNTNVCTSPPSEPDAIATRGVVLEQLQDVEFVVVVLQVGLIEHGVPKFTTFTKYMRLKVRECAQVSKDSKRTGEGFGG